MYSVEPSMVQAFRRYHTAEAQARSRANPCEVCVGQSGTETGFSPNWLTNSIETVIFGVVCKIRDVQMNNEGIAL
jgi:hypothetical protein